MLKKSLVIKMRSAAIQGVFDGTTKTTHYLGACRRIHRPSGTILMFSRDQGAHACGWWKNPEYDKCWHLSLSFFDPQSEEPMPKDEKLTQSWIDLFFGSNQKLLWCEPPHTREGKQFDVWHYRLFYDDNGQPIKPDGEVYSGGKTPKHWKSWSEVQEDKILGRDGKVLVVDSDYQSTRFESLYQQIPPELK